MEIINSIAPLHAVTLLCARSEKYLCCTGTQRTNDDLPVSQEATRRSFSTGKRQSRRRLTGVGELSAKESIPMLPVAC